MNGKSQDRHICVGVCLSNDPCAGDSELWSRRRLGERILVSGQCDSSTTRKPMLLSLLSCVSVTRFAQRQYLGLLRHDPLRTTRPWT